MKAEDFFKQILQDLKVELAEEFDRNFERKGFFDKKWQPNKRPPGKGSLMMQTGALRRGLQSKIIKDGVLFTNSMPYASIHNEGGTITVTAKMKRFFWAMYYKASGAKKKTKSGKESQSAGNRKLSLEAEYWKSLALMKVGKVIKMPERRFVGGGPVVDKLIKNVIDDNVKELEEYMKQQLKMKK